MHITLNIHIKDDGLSNLTIRQMRLLNLKHKSSIINYAVWCINKKVRGNELVTTRLAVTHS